MAGKDYPDFIVCCERHKTPYVVQKYKWMTSQWAPTRKGRTKLTELRNDSNAEFWQHIADGATPDGTIRLHHETVCGAMNCGNKLVADVQALEYVFQMITASIKLCGKARARGVDPSGLAAAFEALAGSATADSVTVTLESLRMGLRLRNTPGHL
ncbi:hypothetical protein NGTWS0302_24130 [Mycolicibacterium cyprinidarum]|uniref:Uncharacterized protein n=1 Tax=Mycolicibacterium cyprinidarum TaxID=2860311 RepID=A0ABQ4VAX9_9MYCO|nr:hypothetical protein NGTWS0302_24130 [Mycolicibacterium sp. NGTWS0302]GJF17105.1 hypothetical protein NGTWS1702_23020 [Mycolicibacterium sp. NGTWSNA01]